MKEKKRSIFDLMFSAENKKEYLYCFVLNLFFTFFLIAFVSAILTLNEIKMIGNAYKFYPIFHDYCYGSVSIVFTIVMMGIGRSPSMI